VTTVILRETLRTVRRQLAVIRWARWCAMGLLFASFLAAVALPNDSARNAAMLLGIGAMVTWVGLMVNSARVSREIQAGSLLASAGQFADAEVWLKRAVLRMSLSVNAKLLGCAELASLLFRQEQHADVVELCRELLRQPMSRVRNLLVSVRLMLADSLLHLNHVQEAYEAMRPVYDDDLSLTERMRLLPIQLRYELAANHSSSAVKALAEKLQIAELLESPQAALVHALLAEACRRENMPDQQRFLSARAWLYHDLDALVDRYQQISPIAAAGGAPVQPPSANS
jgi:hypothetical protein